jgi:hypothetical protein
MSGRYSFDSWFLLSRGQNPNAKPFGKVGHPPN